VAVCSIPRWWLTCDVGLCVLRNPRSTNHADAGVMPIGRLGCEWVGRVELGSTDRITGKRIERRAAALRR
jgi:hypothetical protein